MDQKQEANVSPESQRLDSILSRMPKGAYKFAKHIDVRQNRRIKDYRQMR